MQKPKVCTLKTRNSAFEGPQKTMSFQLAAFARMSHVLQHSLILSKSD